MKYFTTNSPFPINEIGNNLKIAYSLCLCGHNNDWQQNIIDFCADLKENSFLTLLNTKDLNQNKLGKEELKNQIIWSQKAFEYSTLILVYLTNGSSIIEMFELAKYCNSGKLIIAVDKHYNDIESIRILESIYKFPLFYNLDDAVDYTVQELINNYNDDNYLVTSVLKQNLHDNNNLSFFANLIREKQKIIQNNT